MNIAFEQRSERNPAQIAPLALLSLLLDPNAKRPIVAGASSVVATIQRPFRSAACMASVAAGLLGVAPAQGADLGGDCCAGQHDGEITGGAFDGGLDDFRYVSSGALIYF